MSHTPGPWWSQGIYVFQDSESNQPIATARYADGVPLQQAFKTAKLIAAAPELLEALKEAVTDNDSAWITRARAVIAKAEGR